MMNTVHESASLINAFGWICMSWSLSDDGLLPFNTANSATPAAVGGIEMNIFDFIVMTTENRMDWRFIFVNFAFILRKGCIAPTIAVIYSKWNLLDFSQSKSITHDISESGLRLEFAFHG